MDIFDDFSVASNTSGESVVAPAINDSLLDGLGSGVADTEVSPPQHQEPALNDPVDAFLKQEQEDLGDIAPDLDITTRTKNTDPEV